MHWYLSVLKSATEAPGLFHAIGPAHALASRGSAISPAFFINLTSLSRSPRKVLRRIAQIERCDASYICVSHARLICRDRQFIDPWRQAAAIGCPECAV